MYFAMNYITSHYEKGMQPERTALSKNVGKAFDLHERWESRKMQHLGKGLMPRLFKPLKVLKVKRRPHEDYYDTSPILVDIEFDAYEGDTI